MSLAESLAGKFARHDAAKGRVWTSTLDHARTESRGRSIQYSLKCRILSSDEWSKPAESDASKHVQACHPIVRVGPLA